MSRPPSEERNACNRCRYRPDDPGGHYESYFQRANHPQRPLAFWIRYTVFSPKGRTGDAVGELWAVYFDGERERIAVAKEVFPIRSCAFSQQGLDVRIGDAVLDDAHLAGRARRSKFSPTGTTMASRAPPEPAIPRKPAPVLVLRPIYLSLISIRARLGNTSY